MNIYKHEISSKQAEELLDARKDKNFFYSTVNFLRHVDQNTIIDETIKKPLLQEWEKKIVADFTVEGEKHFFVLTYLEWDSKYFDVPTYKLDCILFKHSDQSKLNKAVRCFVDACIEEGEYIFSNIPSEDIMVLQALTSASFNLIETRLTYYGTNLSAFNQSRSGTRLAESSDIANLKQVAAKMVNEFDRVHADPAISNEKADAFLATYIEESIKGFADLVIVPDEKGVPSDAFLTANYLRDLWPRLGCNVSQMVLSAVSNETCKGWYKKLIIEMTYLLKGAGSEYVFFHPASTNRAVIHTYESLGFKFGQASHVLSINKI